MTDEAAWIVRGMIGEDHSTKEERKDLRTPLHEAIEWKMPFQVLQAIVMCNPRAVTIEDIKGDTPMDLFFQEWGTGLMKELKAIINRNQAINDLIISPAYGEPKNLREIYRTTTLLFKAAVCESADHKKNCGFLHNALFFKKCPWSFFNMLLVKHPEQTTEKDVHGNFPLHIAAASDETEIYAEMYPCMGYGCLNESFWYRSCASTSHRFCEDCFLERDEKKHFHRLDQMEKMSSAVCDLITVAPKVASFPNEEGRLPLHIALETGKAFRGKDVEAIFKAAPSALFAKDLKTQMYPFMLSAMVEGKTYTRDVMHHFSSCFSVLISDPSILQKKGHFWKL